MAKQKNTRSGGKFTGSHTTVIDFAASIVDSVSKCLLVDKIAIGLIESSRNRGGSSRRVKVILTDRCLRLTVTANASVQTFYVYGSDVNAMTLQIEQAICKLGMTVTVQRGTTV